LEELEEDEVLRPPDDDFFRLDERLGRKDDIKDKWEMDL